MIISYSSPKPADERKGWKYFLDVIDKSFLELCCRCKQNSHSCMETLLFLARYPRSGLGLWREAPTQHQDFVICPHEPIPEKSNSGPSFLMKR